MSIQNTDSVFQVEAIRPVYDSQAIYSLPIIDNCFGSSFVIEVTSGKLLLLTNAHVVEDALRILLFCPVHPRVPIEAKLESFCYFRDLALLSIQLSDQVAWLARDLCKIKPLVFRNSLDVNIGEPVSAIGYPLGYRNVQISHGFVSGKSANDQPPTGIDTAYVIRQYLQVTSPINGGNSGGPLLDGNGHVIGVTSAGVNLSINYAIPTHVVFSVLSTMKTTLFPKAPALGIFTAPSPIGTVITRVLLHSIFYPHEITMTDIERFENFNSIQQFVKRTTPKLTVDEAFDRSNQMFEDAYKMSAGFKQSVIREGDILVGMSIYNQGIKHRLKINEFGLVYANKCTFLQGQSILDIVDMIDYGSQVQVTINRKGKTEVYTAAFVARDIHNWMQRPSFVTLEPRRFRYLFLAGCIFMEYDMEDTNQVFTMSANNTNLVFSREVFVTQVMNGSLLDTYGSVEVGSCVSEFNGKRVRCLEDIQESFSKLKPNEKCSLSFADNEHFTATASQIKEDDMKLTKLFSIPHWNSVVLPPGLDLK